MLRSIFILVSAALIITTQISDSAFAQAPGPSVAGAIADTPPKGFELSNGIDVDVFDAARNELANHQVLAASGNSYFYVAPIQLVRTGSGRPTVVPLGEATLLSFSLQMQPVDTGELIARIQRSGALEARKENLSALRVHAITITLPIVAERQSIRGAGLRRLSDPIRVAWPMDPNLAKQVSQALNAGTILPTVTVTVLKKLSALNAKRISWSSVTNSKLWQDYVGPSGPEFVTAIQAADVATEILEEINVVQWNEIDRDTTVSVNWLLDRLRAPTEILRDFASPGWASGLAVDVKDFVKLTDVTTKIASDSKNLDDSRWCRSFESLEKELQSLTRNRDVDTGFTFAKVFSGRGKGRSDKDVRKETTAELKTSDCGRDIVSRQFKYDWDGTKYVPKSIVVYQSLRGEGKAKATAQDTAFTITELLDQVDLAVDAP